MKVVATIGGLEVPVGSYTVSPDPLVAGTTEVVLTYELDGKTATGSQGITVNSWKTVLQQNTWEQIADCAAKGKAKEWWNVGDTKTIVANNESLVMTLVDFDHYSLATSDSRYGTSYNNGSNKAAMTFIASTIPASSQTIYAASVSRPYSYLMSSLRTYLNNTILTSLPFSTDLIPTVTIGYYGSNYSSGQSTSHSDYVNQTTTEQIFSAGAVELGEKYNTTLAKVQTKFAYYTAGNSIIFTAPNGTVPRYIYTRDIDYGDSSNAYVRYLYWNDEHDVSGTWSSSVGCSGNYTFIFNL